MIKKVQCVPGGHEVELDHAYWCNRCGFYICHKHIENTFFTNKVTCKKGHEVHKAR